MAATLSYLNAVNAILAKAGMMPVNQLEPTTTPNARLAQNQLDLAHREILTEGWDFNTEYEVTLEVEVGTGFILVPDDFISFVVPRQPWIQLRGEKLYDRDARSSIFSTAVDGTAVIFLEWDDLPEEAKTYSMAKAARRFYEQHVGSGNARNSLYQDELEAKRLLLDRDTTDGRISIFDAPDMQIGMPSTNSIVGGAPRGGRDPLTNRTRK